MKLSKDLELTWYKRRVEFLEKRLREVETEKAQAKAQVQDLISLVDMQPVKGSYDR